MSTTRSLGPRFVLCFAIFALPIAPFPANAIEWSPDGNPFETHIGPNSELASLPDGSGGLFLVWVQSLTDILAQRVDADGNLLWGPNGISVSSATGNQTALRIAPDGGGGFVVVWSDTRSDALGDIYVQRIAANGTPAWTADGVALVTGVDRQNAPDIVGDGAGGAIATWVVNNTDIAARAINSAGVPQGPAIGTTLCAATGNQTVPKIASDGAAGAIVTWQDGRVAQPDVYAARFTSAGSVPWTGDGVAVLAAGQTQSAPEIVADGAGGAIISLINPSLVGLLPTITLFHLNSAGAHVWSTAGVIPIAVPSGQSNPRILTDGTGGVFVMGNAPDVEVQHLDSGGNLLWTSTGVSLASSGTPMGMGRDGSGNLLVSWREASGAIRAQLVNGSGVAQWPSTSGGLLIGTATGDRVQIGPDGANGALLAWDDSGADDVYGLRVLAGGNFSFIPPSLDVADLPNDEGGWVRLSVDLNTIDLFPTVPEETGFAVWRRIALPSALADQGRVSRDEIARIMARAQSERLRLAPMAANAAGFPPGTWEQLGFYPSYQIRTYTVPEPTRTDFTGSGNADEVFLIVTHTTTPTVWYVSAPDSGHSIDNLPPMAPQSLAGAFQPSSTVHLTWLANQEPDLARYAVYRGADAGFVPSAANRLGYATSPLFDDTGFTPSSYYKVSALDRHGNESPHALLTPIQVTGVTGQPPTQLFLAPPSPNPASTSSLLEFGLPRSGRVELLVFDILGRRVVALRDGLETAGVRRVTWDLRDHEGGRVNPGLYWALLRADGRSLTRRFVVRE